MKIFILSLGRFKSDPLGQIFSLYEKRLQWEISLKEIDPKLSPSISSTLRKEKEAEALQEQLIHQSYCIGLDEKGKDLNSTEFAQLLEGLKNSGQTVSFLIGGADGLSDDLKGKANQILSFGRCTWPHLMVRVLLIEQIYRAQQILNGHPYHRS